MPYRRYGGYSRRAIPRRKPAYRRKRVFRKKQFARKKRAMVRTARQANISGWNGGLSMQVSNNVRRQRFYKIQWRDCVSIFPEDDTTGGFGAASWAICANQPNDVYLAAASANHLGTVMSSTDANGQNQLCEKIFSEFQHGYVYKAVIKVVATPTGQLGGELWNFTDEASIYLTLSQDKSPFCTGTTVASLVTRAKMNTARNTVQGATLREDLGSSKGCMLTGTFYPKRLLNVRDLQDKSSLWFTTNGDYTVATTAPTHSAYWQIMILPKSPFFTSPTTATEGVPYPHRLDVSIDYYCCMFEPVGDALNNQPI